VTQPATDAPAPSHRTRTILIVGALAVVAVVVAVFVAAAVRPRPQSEYDDATRERFLDACMTNGGEPVRDTCTCVYDQIVQTVPFDRFEVMDELLGAQLQAAPGQPLDLPDDVATMLQQCVSSS
jgi:hypothetical protein